MIEADRGPLVLVVATFALRAVPSGVDVLNLVAIDARCTDSLVALADMAGGACHVAVRALERKFGLVVIERRHATPCRLAVAIVARLTKTALVRIVCLMTIETASWGVAKLYRWRVTAVALH